MLETITAEMIYCRERARQAREKADAATADQTKRSHLAAEGRWLAIARSHELQQQLSTMLGDQGRITSTERKQRNAFEP
jgi:hypothetical protein